MENKISEAAKAHSLSMPDYVRSDAIDDFKAGAEWFRDQQSIKILTAKIIASGPEGCRKYTASFELELDIEKEAEDSSGFINYEQSIKK